MSKRHDVRKADDLIAGFDREIKVTLLLKACYEGSRGSFRFIENLLKSIDDVSTDSLLKRRIIDTAVISNKTALVRYLLSFLEVNLLYTMASLLTMAPGSSMIHTCLTFYQCSANEMTESLFKACHITRCSSHIGPIVDQIALIYPHLRERTSEIASVAFARARARHLSLAYL
jgi:hypothetical protein